MKWYIWVNFNILKVKYDKSNNLDFLNDINLVFKEEKNKSFTLL